MPSCHYRLELRLNGCIISEHVRSLAALRILCYLHFHTTDIYFIELCSYSFIIFSNDRLDLRLNGRIFSGHVRSLAALRILWRRRELRSPTVGAEEGCEAITNRWRLSAYKQTWHLLTRICVFLYFLVFFMRNAVHPVFTSPDFSSARIA